MFDSSPPAPLREGDSSLFDESASEPTCVRSDGRFGSTQDLERRAGLQASSTRLVEPRLGRGSEEPHEQAQAQSGRSPLWAVNGYCARARLLMTLERTFERGRNAGTFGALVSGIRAGLETDKPCLSRDLRSRGSPSIQSLTDALKPCV